MDTQVMLAGLALLGTIAAVGSPLLMSVLSNRNAQALKKQDWDRQDEVAAKAEAVAQRNASLIAELNQATTAAAKLQLGKLEVIHANGNSTLTASLQLALDGLKRELLLLRRESTPDEIMIEVVTKKIAELQLVIDERNKSAAGAEIASLKMQQAESIEANRAVGIQSAPPMVSPGLGDVTKRVLRGEGGLEAPQVRLTETQKTSQADAAVATVEAASETVDAAAKTVEAMKAASAPPGKPPAE